MVRVLVFVVILMAAGGARAACAAECPVQELSALWEGSEAIFVGKVMNDAAPGPAPVAGYEYGAVFEVVRGWKNASDGGVMTVRAKHHPRLCTVPFAVGGEYLVFAKKNSKEGYYTDISPCTANRPSAYAAEWINELDLLQARLR